MAQVAAGDLEIEVLQDGSQDGSQDSSRGGSADAKPVLLLHGWPDDATTWNAVSPRLAAAGLRTLAPMLRGFGGTRFRSASAPRTGNAAMLAIDAIGLMDALGIERFSVAGHDWGAAIGTALAVGWPERVERLALLSSPTRLGGLPTPSFAQAQRQWYHWFQATRRGEQAIREDPRGFAHLMWVNWSPQGWFDEATFDRVARSFNNPDWVDVTLHSYRARWNEAETDPRSAWLEQRIESTATLALPCVFFQGDADGVNPPEHSADIASKFEGPFERVVLPGVGHFPTREAAEQVAAKLVAHFS